MSTIGQSSNRYGKKVTGVVLATVGEKRAKFVMVGDKKFANGTDKIVVNLEDLPERPQLNQSHTGKQFRIRMSSEGDTVEAITPVTGHYRAKLVDLGARANKDSDPMPYEKPNFNDPDKSHLEFFASYKISKGMYKGVITPAYYMHYKFTEDENNPGYTRFAGNFDNKQATRLFQLRDWGIAHGIWRLEGRDIDGETIPWNPETVLPTILEQIMDKDLEVDLTFKDGKITDVQPITDDDSDEVETPKKSSIDEVIEELGYDKPATKKSEPDDELDVDADFPKDDPATYTTRLKKVAKKSADDDEEL